MFYNVLILKYFAKFTGNTSQKLKFSITDFFRKCDQFDSFFWQVSGILLLSKCHTSCDLMLNSMYSLNKQI